MTYRRILVAVDDSRPGLQAARAAVELAGGHDGVVRAVTVLGDHVVADAIGADRLATEERLASALRSVLTWVASLAETEHVRCETVQRAGEPFRAVLDEADAWEADVIVIGRSDRRGVASAYLGSATAHVLEFTDRPVLVVPAEPPPGRAATRPQPVR